MIDWGWFNLKNFRWSIGCCWLYRLLFINIQLPCNVWTWGVKKEKKKLMSDLKCPPQNNKCQELSPAPSGTIQRIARCGISCLQFVAINLVKLSSLIIFDGHLETARIVYWYVVLFEGGPRFVPRISTYSEPWVKYDLVGSSPPFSTFNNENGLSKLSMT